MPPSDFESVLDRRLGDFEKLIDVRMTSIQDGVNEMRSTLGVFIGKVSNLHVDYVPRVEQEREQVRLNNEITLLKNKVENLQMWRNYAFGAIALLGFALGIVAQSQIWK